MKSLLKMYGFLAFVLMPALMLTGIVTAQTAKAPVPPLDFPRMMQPIPSSAAFRDPGYYVWCGTMVRGDDGKYHLYYSRWKVSDGFEAWVTRSEVAHAIGDTPNGPFAFHDVALPARGKQFWDGLVTHNPTIHRFGKKYYLYYMGVTGDGVVMPTLNWEMRNRQRVGVAVADNPNGPWKRFDKPVIDVSADTAAPDSLCATNPSLTQGRDGRFYLLYKAVGRQKPLPIGGPVVHLMAVSDSPTGPFHKDLTPLFTIPGNNFPFEDPFFWYDRKRDSYFVILKDNNGVITGLGHSSLVLYQSKDLAHWEKAEHAFVSDLQLQWQDRGTLRVKGLERPQLTFDSAGDPIALIAAIREDNLHSYNVRIPLSIGDPTPKASTGK
jgi:hypothetical protein